MNKNVFLALLILLGGCANVAYGQQKTITILAPISCKEWIDARVDEKKLKSFSMYNVYRLWLLGLLTGLNANSVRPNLLEAVDGNLVSDWMDQFCAKKEDSDLFEGANVFLDEVARRRKK